MYSQGRSKLSIAAQTGVSHNTAKKYMATFEASGLTFEQINGLNDKELDEFFGAVRQAPPPSWNRYEPTLNETFEDFANHYGTTILPTRAYRPRDYV